MKPTDKNQPDKKPAPEPKKEELQVEDLEHVSGGFTLIEKTAPVDYKE
jgi:hypothetical protein